MQPYYYIASMIQKISTSVLFTVSDVLLTEGSYNEAELKQHVKKAFRTIGVILTPAIGLVVLGGGILLQFFGKSYANETLQFLQLYSISTFFTAILLVFNAIMKVKHQKIYLVIFNILASILTLVRNHALLSLLEN